MRQGRIWIIVQESSGHASATGRDERPIVENGEALNRLAGGAREVNFYKVGFAVAQGDGDTRKA